MVSELPGSVVAVKTASEDSCSIHPNYHRIVGQASLACPSENYRLPKPPSYRVSPVRRPGACTFAPPKFPAAVARHWWGRRFRLPRRAQLASGPCNIVQLYPPHGPPFKPFCFLEIQRSRRTSSATQRNQSVGQTIAFRGLPKNTKRSQAGRAKLLGSDRPGLPRNACQC
jgi:hypothetical protein